MAQPATQTVAPIGPMSGGWSPSPMPATAVAPAYGDLAAAGPVADLHRMIEARLAGADPAWVGLDQPDGVAALNRAVSRALGWAALLGSLAALAAWLL